MARLAKCLQVLWDQVKNQYPNRKTDSDGWIASASHHAQNPSSDHEADSRGLVHALDLTHDPAHGFDSYRFADHLLEKRDPRIKYLISNRRIAGDEDYALRNGRKAWTWYPYNGANSHNQHVHISCNRIMEDDERLWDIPKVGFGLGFGLGLGFTVEGSGKGSWYSQYDGQFRWVDKGDRPGSNKLGVPDSQQGFAMYSNTTLGKWRDVKAPNGMVLRLQQTDIGPHPNTGRKIDIAAVAAERFGYSPKNFPTDGVFYWGKIVEPQQDEIKTTKTFDARVVEVQRLLGFAESEQDGYFGPQTETAVKWFQRRNGLEVDGVVGAKTMLTLQTVETQYVVLTQDQFIQLVMILRGGRDAA